MAQVIERINVCTFNCRSVKSSVNEISDLCLDCDIICLQEHWLLPNEVNFLGSINGDFLSTGNSAVDVGRDVLVGRPFGGTGILYRKSLSEYITIVDTNDDRISAIILNSVHGPVLLVSVYMPTDYRDSECFEDYIATCASISALYQECDVNHMLVAGDFNCHVGSRFFDIFLNFASENNLQQSDITRLNDDTFTYNNDAGTALSWIDHILCSSIIDSMVSRCTVRYDLVSSDHKPLLITFDGLLNFV